jgi:hypothetical protein
LIFIYYGMLFLKERVMESWWLVKWMWWCHESCFNDEFKKIAMVLKKASFKKKKLSFMCSFLVYGIKNYNRRMCF